MDISPPSHEAIGFATQVLDLGLNLRLGLAEQLLVYRRLRALHELGVGRVDLETQGLHFVQNGLASIQTVRQELALLQQS